LSGAETKTETRPPWPKRLAVLVALAAIYFVAGKLGLRLAFAHPSATAVWAPTGIALGAFLLLGPAVWPAIFAGAFLANVTTEGTALTSLGIATGNALEGLVGAHLVRRFAGGRHAFNRVRHVFLFAVLAALVSTAISATFGVTSLSLGGFARWQDFASIWLTWWLGDAAGALIVAPAILTWFDGSRLEWKGVRLREAGALLGALILAGLVVFGGLFPSLVKTYPLQTLCIPVLLWAAIRFGAREAAMAVLLLSVIATWGTLGGFGPFVRPTPNESLLLLQAFLGVVSVTTQILAAVVLERRKVEDQLRHLSVSDPLTGLANYRQFIAVLESEVRRSARTGRPFALVMLDVDDLKRINDQFGHLTGSQALCRVADALRRNCRAVDTASRFGGDEFALILPETDAPAAWLVARRVRERLEQDTATPRVLASVGVAVYPEDGETPERLIELADRLMYESKLAADLKAGEEPR
jgi:diguanylate cyclase (GGDEF)-like protein